MTPELPAMAYKPGSMFQWDGEMFDYLVVTTHKEMDAALADGWSFSKPPREPEPKTGISGSGDMSADRMMNVPADESLKPRRGRPPKEKTE